jgi:peroxiredoxin
MDDLKSVFDKINKAEALLDNLDKKRTEDVVEKNAGDPLNKEHQATIDNARQTIASIKDKLGKELADKTLELDKCQEELGTLQARLKVGEISEDFYATKSKHLVDKIKSLEKKVIETQSLINARFAEDIAPVLESKEVVAPMEPASEAPVAPEMKAVPQELSARIEETKMEEATDQPSQPGQPAAISGDPAPSEQSNGPEGIKQEEKAAATVKEEEKKEEPGISHKPSLHLHPLRDTVSNDLHSPMPSSTSKNRTIIVVIAAFVVGLLIWGGITLFFPRGGSNVGDVAPNFVMQLGDDNTTALSSLRGKTVLLVFWDRDFWDGQFFYVNGVQRQLYTPDKLNQLYSKYPRSEFTIVAIASGTSNNEIDKITHDYEVQFPVIVDSFGKLRDSYKIGYEPTYVFLDKDGVIRARVEGPILAMSDLEQYVYNTSKNIPIKPGKPPISDVIIQGITEKSATINWTTDKPTTTQLDIDGKNILSAITPSPQTLHSLELKDLSLATAYHIRILYNVDNINVSEHSFGALSSTVVSKKYSFNTSNVDTSPPEISNISPSFITDSSVTVAWKTDEPASGDVDYSVNKSYSDTASQTDKLSIWHTVKVDGLKPDTTYNLRLRSKDASGKETSQEIEPLTTQNLVEIAAKVGKRAPDFSLYSLDGTKFALSQFQGRKVLLTFWLEGCPACEAEMPIIQTAYNKYSRDQLIILAVNVRGDPDKVSYYVAKEKFTFPILMDTQGNVDDIYRAPFFPTSYMIDSTGIIREILGERFQTISQIDDLVSKLN